MANGGFSPVWPGPCLLVPVTVDVLLVGEPDRVAKTVWARTGTSYYNLWKGLIPDAPPPFGPAPVPPVGANLMWTLPFSLRQGASDDQTGEVVFPNVPNRWIILRIMYPADGGAPGFVAGVLQSDLLSPLASATDPSQYPDPDNPAAVRRLGGYVPVAAWSGPAGPATPFLHAVGPGEVSWSVSFDNVLNVIAFHDDLPADPATFTYLVNGWYADPATDPLQALPTDDPAAWQEALRQQFNWGVGDTLQDVLDAEADWEAWAASRGIDGGSAGDLPPQLRQLIETWQAWRAAHGVAQAQPPLPRQTILAGMAATVQWEGPRVGYGTGVPGHGLAVAQVAVGSTAAESIAAYLAKLTVDENGGSQHDLFTVQRALEAFQQDLLFDLTTDPVGVESLLHQARFGSTFGGSEWIVVRPDEGDQDAGGFPVHGGQQTIPLDAAQTATLTDLDTAQRALDADRARLATQRAELFAVSFKQANLGKNPPATVRTMVERALAALEAAVQASLDAVEAGEARVTSLAAGLDALLAGHYALKRVDLPGYYAPNDPVVTIAGAELDSKLSPPGVYDEEETLFTRFTGQTVRGLETSWTLEGVDLPLVLGVGDLLTKVVLPQGTAIPKEAPDLWLEALFLDTSAALLLATLYFERRNDPYTPDDLKGLTAKIRAQQTTVWNRPELLGVTRRALQEVSGFQGVVPSPVAVEFRAGQPWTPIFLDWRVQWSPTSMDPAGELDGWALGEIDYEWLPPHQVPTPPATLVFSGRTVLNPKVAQEIKHKLATFQHDPNYDALPVYLRQDLEEVAGVVGDLDLLTQSMSGLTDQLVTRLQAMARAPTDPDVARLLGDSALSFRPNAGSITQTVPLPFFPLRSGHLQILDVWVVDSFGQVMRGKDPNLPATSPLPDPIRSESLFTPDPDASPGANDSYLQLAPRVSQASRAELRFVQADDDAVYANSSDLTSPVCGWVMPNHLDGSLMVFDAGGANLGAVFPVQRDVDPTREDATGLLWEAVPGTQAPLGAPPSLPSRHLQAMVDALLEEGLAGSGALEELLDVIDSSLWRVDPFAPQPGNLSVLLGRPLAVVRARVSLDLFGYPDYNQSWIETGRYYVDAGGGYAPVPPPFVSVPWNARVGDLRYRTNGVLGYYQGDRYDRFYAAHGAGFQTAGLRRAARRGERLLPPGGAVRLGSAARTPSRMQLLAGATSGYVEMDHLVPLAPDGPGVELTILMDPSGSVPTITGSLPAAQVALAQGPVAQALQKMTATFRMGPLLVDPARVQVPLPADVKGRWGWIARRDVATWAEEAPVDAAGPVAGLEDAPRTLTEGWLTLSGAERAPRDP